jgi:hypothetical protein
MVALLAARARRNLRELAAAEPAAARGLGRHRSGRRATGAVQTPLLDDAPEVG